MHPDGGIEVSQPGIRPRMLKTLIGAGHAEFAGLKQQDAQEFLIWLLSRIQRQGKPSGCVEQSLLEQEREMMKDEGDENGTGWGGYIDPTKCFKFGIQQRIQCLGCGGVKYRVDEQDNINITVPHRIKYPPLPTLACNPLEIFISFLILYFAFIDCLSLHLLNCLVGIFLD